MLSYFVVLARNCLASTLDYTVMQMRKINREKGFYVEIFQIFSQFYWSLVYDLLGKRHIDDVIHTFLIFCVIKKDRLMLPPGAVAAQEKIRI